MDAHLFRLFAKASQPYLQDCLIEKIQEPDTGLLTINLYGHGTKKQLNWSYKRGDSFCFLSDTRMTAQKAPSALVMRLRKHLNNHRIASAVFQFCQRKLWLLPSGQPDADKKAAWLCLDLIKGPSLHFLNASDAPLADDPEWPAPDTLAQACEDWRDWPILTPRLRKKLAQLDPPEQWALIEDLRSANGSVFLYSQKDEEDEIICKISAWPEVSKPSETCREFYPEDWLAAFARAGNDLIWRKLHDREQARLLNPSLKRLGRLHKILEKLGADEKRLKSMASLEASGQCLRENLWRFAPGTRMSQFIIGDCGAEQKIILNERLDLQENMERFFHEAKRGKRGLKMLEERKKALLEEISILEQGNVGLMAHKGMQEEAEEQESQKTAYPSRLAALQASLPKNVQALASSDGHVFLRGKDARGNRAILKLASPHDIWAHVETGQGAHVVIRLNYPGEDLNAATLAEAASLAAIRSWHKDAVTCNVMFAEVRHVRPARHGPAGKVLIDRLIRTENYKIDPEIEIRLAQNTLQHKR